MAIIESLLYAMASMILDAMEAKSHLVMISGTVLFRIMRENWCVGLID